MSDTRAASKAAAVVLDTAVSPTRGIYVGVTGNLNVTMKDGGDMLFKNVPVGVFTVAVTMVKTATTTATELIFLW